MILHPMRAPVGVKSGFEKEAAAATIPRMLKTRFVVVALATFATLRR